MIIIIPIKTIESVFKRKHAGWPCHPIFALLPSCVFKSLSLFTCISAWSVNCDDRYSRQSQAKLKNTLPYQTTYSNKQNKTLSTFTFFKRKGVSIISDPNPSLLVLKIILRRIQQRILACLLRYQPPQLPWTWQDSCWKNNNSRIKIILMETANEDHKTVAI